MALNNKKYEAIHGKTSDSAKAKMKEKFDGNMHSIAVDFPDDFPELSAVIYQIGQLEEELDALRLEISNNKDKAAFPGFGTSGSTCLAGDTTTITTSQASAITANKAKVSFTGGLGTTLSFGKMIVTPGVKGGKTTYSIVMTVVSGVDPKAITKSVTLQLI
tara:strand:- start:69 stop:551 length:483 start_codon:yes stop_codon:yes gene_type:complete